MTEKKPKLKVKWWELEFKPSEATFINILNPRILYLCPICGECFSSILSLKGHVLSKHRQNILWREHHKKAPPRKRKRSTSIEYIKA